MKTRIRARALASLLCLLLPWACAAGELTVSAAASLNDAFTAIARRFEATHPATTVALNFGASGALLQQLVSGAPVDVFASADQETMDAAAAKGLIDPATRRDFATNSLVVVVPADSGLKLAGLADLAGAGISRIAIGNPASVPVGRYAMRAIEAADLREAVAAKTISTQNVRQSLDYVARGEVDAGFVYATDARLLREQVKVAFEVPLEAPVTYPLAATATSASPQDAAAFVDFVASLEGQEILADFGFRRP